jgi:hypothetical protein
MSRVVYYAESPNKFSGHSNKLSGLVDFTETEKQDYVFAEPTGDEQYLDNEPFPESPIEDFPKRIYVIYKHTTLKQWEVLFEMKPIEMNKLDDAFDEQRIIAKREYERAVERIEKKREEFGDAVAKLLG